MASPSPASAHPSAPESGTGLGFTGAAGITGLTAAEVAEREAAGLVNVQSRDTSRSLGQILRVHVFTLFNLAIALCAVVVILMGRWLDLLFSLAAVANVVIGVVQEYSAKRKLDRIALLHQDDVVVIRDGARVPLPMARIVRDDVVVLRRGDQVPVDGEVLVSDGLDMDEALLTGENDPVPKTPGDAVLSGSAVVAGAGAWFFYQQTRFADAPITPAAESVVIASGDGMNSVLRKLREAGVAKHEALVEGARSRLRPIIMTSLAFILGVVPLAIASGAGAGSKHAIGTGVIGGMLTAAVLAIFWIPLFYVMICSFFDRTDSASEGVKEDSL